MTDPFGRIRELLGEPVSMEKPWALLAAATFAALAAVLMAGVVVLGPGVALDDSAAVSNR